MRLRTGAGDHTRTDRPLAAETFRSRRPLRTGRVPAIAIAIAAAAAAAATLPSSAAAGVMTYGTCNYGGPAGTGGWSASPIGAAPAGTSSGITTNTCSSGGMMTAVMGTDRASRGGVGVAWTFTAPANTRIVGGNLSMTSHSAWAGNSAYLVRGWHDTPSDPNVIWGPVPTQSESHAYTGNVPLEPDGDWGSMTWGVMCSHVFGPSCDTWPGGTWQLYGGTIELRDQNGPVISSVSGSLPTTGTVTGSRTAAYAASDQGVGLYRSEKFVDGQLVGGQVFDANGGRCSPITSGTHIFGSPVPCKLSGSDTVTFDTAGLRDGEHTFRVVAVDASGNRTVVVDRSLVTDNKPVNTAAPAVDVVSSGQLRIGSTVRAARGTWDRSPTSYEYEWFRCWQTTDSCTLIDDSLDGADYDVRALDAFHSIRVRVRAKNAAGTSDWVSSARTAIVPDADGTVDPIPAAFAPPTWTAESNVTEPRPGDALTIAPGRWTGPSVALTFRFKRCSPAGTCVTAAEGSARSYTLTAADIDSTIVGEVTGANAHGSRTAQTAATGAVLPTERSSGRGPTPKPGDEEPPVPTLPDVIVPGPNTGGGTQVVAVPNGVCEGGAARLTARFGKSSKATVKWGKGAALKLTLVCLRTGKPISGAELAVATSQLGATKAKASAVKTSANGVATLKLPKGVSRSIAIGWRSDSLAKTYATQTSATLLVRSKVTLKVGPAKVRERGTIRFKGAIAGAPKGILVNVQALDGKRWRTFDQVKTGKKGAVKYAYRFSPRSRAGAKFTFRIMPVAGQKKLATVAAASKSRVVRLVR